MFIYSTWWSVSNYIRYIRHRWHWTESHSCTGTADRSWTNVGEKSVSECTKYTISEADVQQLHMVSDTLHSGQILAARQGPSATDVLAAGVMQTINPRMSHSLCFMKTIFPIPRHTSDACGANLTDRSVSRRFSCVWVKVHSLGRVPGRCLLLEHVF